MTRRWMTGGLMVCCFAVVAAQGQQQPRSDAAVKQTPTAPQAKAGQQTAPNTAMETAGEQKFQQNCSRCHNAPQELSPRISGTVVMHMRVRASLSEADAKAILHYLAP